MLSCHPIAPDGLQVHQLIAQPAPFWLQDRSVVANELAAQQNLHGQAQRDVERFKNREQLLAKVRQMQ